MKQAFSLYLYIKYKIQSVYARIYGAKYCFQDFKWASSHLLPTHPKLFITAWHMHVAGKWQILIKQSFQRLFSPLSGRNSKLITEWDYIQLGKKKSVVFMNKIPTLLYLLSRMELNKKKMKLKNCIQTNNWQDDFFTSREQLRESCKRYRNHVKSSDVFNVKDRVEILELE